MYSFFWQRNGDDPSVFVLIPLTSSKAVAGEQAEVRVSPRGAELGIPESIRPVQRDPPFRLRASVVERCVAELSRSYIKRRRCAAPGPGVSAAAQPCEARAAHAGPQLAVCH
jgi:hypothetical protein